jgi:ribosomal protein S12 methylthiotransferase accessory factor
VSVTAAALPKGYMSGTHRLVAPEQTLARVRGFQDAIGVTRLADVTGLDRLGIPVYCAIRPLGLILQSTNGKGARAIDAQASALMEALEHHHAEHPASPLRRASARELAAEGATVLDPRLVPSYRRHTFWSDDFRIEWVEAEELLTKRSSWLPASAVYSGRMPGLHDFTANGLASGNHEVEATLHALYEILERDAISRLSVDGRVRVRPPACRIVRIDTLTGIPAELAARAAAADVSLILIDVYSRAGVHTLWAVLVDRAPFAPASTVNVGYGTHLDPEVAAVRAITEAAQSRLTYIHGAREDLAYKITEQSAQGLRSVADFFDRLRPDTDWQALDNRSTRDLAADYARVLEGLARDGVSAVYRAALTRPPFDVPVVKVIAPDLQLNRRFF